MNPELFIMSDVDASDVVVTAECTNGQVIQLCCGGMCEAGTTVTKTGIELKAGQMLDTECHSIGFTESLTEKIKSVEAKISAYYASDLSSKIEFNLTMEGEDGAGVEGIVADTGSGRDPLVQPSGRADARASRRTRTQVGASFRRSGTHKPRPQPPLSR